MKFHGSWYCFASYIAIACVGFSSAGYADIEITNSLKMQTVFSDDLSLETSDENVSDSQLLELKTKIEGDIRDDLSFLIEARGVKNYGERGSFDVDTGEFSGNDDYLELRQYWVDFDDIGGYEPLNLRIGRQRLKEDYGIWWNRDFDAVKVSHETSLLKSYVAFGQTLAEYRTSDDTFNEDDEEIFRLFGESSLQWTLNHFVEGRFLYQQDYSGLESVGTLVNANDYDSADADILWVGARFGGMFSNLGNLSGVHDVRYRLDVIGMTGHEDRLTTTPAGDFRNVTGRGKRDLSGWALDVGIDVPVAVSETVTPVVHVGYAYGSGDNNPNDNDDHAFRQTGLDSNSSRLGGFSSSVNNYGSVLRADLSNLHIGTVGLTIPVTDAFDVAGFYHYYSLDDAAGTTSLSGIEAPVNGQDSDVGQALDIILNMDVSKQLDIESSVVDRVNLKATLGAFRSGDAYGTASGETATRAQLDLSVRF